jgi:hypothetical protein
LTLPINRKSANGGRAKKMLSETEGSGSGVFKNKVTSRRLCGAEIVRKKARKNGAKAPTDLGKFYRKNPSVRGDSLKSSVENNGVSWEHKAEGASVYKCRLGHGRLHGLRKH